METPPFTSTEKETATLNNIADVASMFSPTLIMNDDLSSQISNEHFCDIPQDVFNMLTDDNPIPQDVLEIFQNINIQNLSPNDFEKSSMDVQNHCSNPNFRSSIEASNIFSDPLEFESSVYVPSTPELKKREEQYRLRKEKLEELAKRKKEERANIERDSLLVQKNKNTISEKKNENTDDKTTTRKKANKTKQKQKPHDFEKTENFLFGETESDISRNILTTIQCLQKRVGFLIRFKECPELEGRMTYIGKGHKPKYPIDLRVEYPIHSNIVYARPSGAARQMYLHYGIVRGEPVKFHNGKNGVSSNAFNSTLYQTENGNWLTLGTLFPKELRNGEINIEDIEDYEKILPKINTSREILPYSPVQHHLIVGIEHLLKLLPEQKDSIINNYKKKQDLFDESPFIVKQSEKSKPPPKNVVVQKQKKKQKKLHGLLQKKNINKSEEISKRNSDSTNVTEKTKVSKFFVKTRQMNDSTENHLEGQQEMELEEKNTKESELVNKNASKKRSRKENQDSDSDKEEEEEEVVIKVYRKDKNRLPIYMNNGNTQSSPEKYRKTDTSIKASKKSSRKGRKNNNRKKSSLNMIQFTVTKVIRNKDETSKTNDILKLVSGDVLDQTMEEMNKELSSLQKVNSSFHSIFTNFKKNIELDLLETTQFCICCHASFNNEDQNYVMFGSKETEKLKNCSGFICPSHPNNHVFCNNCMIQFLIIKLENDSAPILCCPGEFSTSLDVTSMLGSTTHTFSIPCDFKIPNQFMQYLIESCDETSKPEMWQQLPSKEITGISKKEHLSKLLYESQYMVNWENALRIAPWQRRIFCPNPNAQCDLLTGENIPCNSPIIYNCKNTGIPMITTCGTCQMRFCTGCSKNVDEEDDHEHIGYLGDSPCYKLFHSPWKQTDEEVSLWFKSNKLDLVSIEQQSNMYRRLAEAIENDFKLGMYQKCPVCSQLIRLDQGNYSFEIPYKECLNPVNRKTTHVVKCSCGVCWCYLCERILPRCPEQKQTILDLKKQTLVAPYSGKETFTVSRHNDFWQFNKDGRLKTAEFSGDITENTKYIPLYAKYFGQCPMFFEDICKVNPLYPEDFEGAVNYFHIRKTRIFFNERIRSSGIMNFWRALKFCDPKVKAFHDQCCMKQSNIF